MRRTWIDLTALLLFVPRALAQELQFGELGKFELEKADTIPHCPIAVRTSGKLDNTGGNTIQLSSLFGIYDNIRTAQARPKFHVSARFGGSIKDGASLLHAKTPNGCLEVRPQSGSRGCTRICATHARQNSYIGR